MDYAALTDLYEKAKTGYFDRRHGLPENPTQEQKNANARAKEFEFAEALRLFATRDHETCYCAAVRHADQFWIATNIHEQPKYFWSGARLIDNPGMWKPRPEVNVIEWYRRIAVLLEGQDKVPLAYPTPV